jgi:hypothetical protein
MSATAINAIEVCSKRRGPGSLRPDTADRIRRQTAPPVSVCSALASAIREIAFSIDCLRTGLAAHQDLGVDEKDLEPNLGLLTDGRPGRSFCYAPFKKPPPGWAAAFGAERHISAGATFSIPLLTCE